MVLANREQVVRKEKGRTNGMKKTKEVISKVKTS